MENHKPLLVRIRDEDGPKFDMFALAPATMTSGTADEIVSNLISTVRAADPDSYLWEELEARLVAAGFVIPNVVPSTARW